MGEVSTKDLAWCPICFDALECQEVMRPVPRNDAVKVIDANNKEVTEEIDHFIYYCFGCDKHFELKEVKS